MKKNNLILLFVILQLIFVPVANANYPYFFFKKSDIRIAKETYFRYIKPQIKSIIQDFFTIIKKEGELQTELINIYNKILTIEKKYIVDGKSCNRPEQTLCSKYIKKIYHLTQNLDDDVFKTLNHLSKFSLTNIDGEIELGVYLHNISSFNYKIMHIIEKALSLSDQYQLDVLLQQESIYQTIHKMAVFSRMSITTTMDPAIKEDFDFILFSFISPLEAQIVPSNQPDFLIDRLEDLNMSWNSFNMKLSKGNIKVSNNVSRGIQVIHRRWVSILKILLQRTVKNRPKKI